MTVLTQGQGEDMGMLENVKVLLTVAGTTILAGVSTVLDHLPDVLGIIASFLGIVLTSMFIYAQADKLKGIRLENARTRLEIAALRAKEAERAAITAASPMRRDEDRGE